MSHFADAGREDIVRILKSRIITLAPLDGKGCYSPVRIHEGLVKFSSQNLYASITAAEHEFTTQFNLPQASENTLLCYATWAYSGDYFHESSSTTLSVEQAPTNGEITLDLPSDGASTAVGEPVPEPEPEPVPIPEPEALIETVDEPYDLEWGAVSSVKKRCKKCKSRHSKTKKCVPKIELELEEPETEKPEEFTLNRQSPTNSIHAVPSNELHPLMLHMEVYRFGHDFSISALKELSTNKIVSHVSEMDLSDPNQLNAVFDVLEYASAHLSKDDDFLIWLARYASWELESLRQDIERLDRLIKRDGGVFGGLMIQFVSPAGTSPF